MEKVYDLIIIGSGPAGLAAAVYAARAELDFFVLERSAISGGQVLNTYEVDNYPGIPGVSGSELSVRLREHCDRLGAEFVTGELADITAENDIKHLKLYGGTEYLTRTVIIATGATPRLLGVPGEEELSGMGVSYCATCDGAFFRSGTVAVVGGGDVAVEDAIFLARICKKVYLIHRREGFRAAKTLLTHLKSLDNVELLVNKTVKEIHGVEEDRVTGVTLCDTVTEELSELPLEGIFIAVGNTPGSAIFASLVATDKAGYIVADETCITSAAGIFAAGDVRTKSLRQIVTAASDGANAVISAERYLASE